MPEHHPKLAPGHVRLDARDRRTLPVVGWLDATPPAVTGGYGGWQPVARPRRRALIEWVGADPYQVSFGMIIDGYLEQPARLSRTLYGPRSVEPVCNALHQMAITSRPGQAPTRVRLSGMPASVPRSVSLWVIDQLTWGDCIRNRSGTRLRQAVQLVLLQATSSADVTVSAEAVAYQHSPNPRLLTRQEKVPPPGGSRGLQLLAAHVYGQASRWRDIIKANPGLRDPERIKQGTLVRLP
jgi:hypothetical protein